MLSLSFYSTSILVLFLELMAITTMGNVILQRYRKKVLIGFSYRNVTSLDTNKCLEHCLEDCKCLSFQICAAFQFCQLCSSTKLLNASSFQNSEDCIYIEFEHHDKTKINVNTGQCSRSQCMTNVNCCLTSTPCHNGGTCIPSVSQHRRFTCKCRPGFKGERCEEMMISCRDYKDGNRVPGNYTVVDRNGKTYQVFCDFGTQSEVTWTLVQSYSLENKDSFASPFTEDNPRNEENFTWFDYRLSYNRMEYIHEYSSKWRVTCDYNASIKLLYFVDFVRVSISVVPLFKIFANNGECIRVEHFAVRGHYCSNCEAYMLQSDVYPLYFDTMKSRNSCDFQIPEIKNCSTGPENNFGYYKCVNHEHRCSSNSSATTQVWLGSA